MDARTFAELAMVAVFLVWLLAATFWVLHALVNHVRDEAKKRAKPQKEIPGIFTNRIPPTPPAVPRIHVNDKGEQFRMGGAGLVPLREGIDFPGDGMTDRQRATTMGDPINLDNAADRCTYGWNPTGKIWVRDSSYRHGVTVKIKCEALDLEQAKAIGRAVDVAVWEALADIDAKSGGTNAE